MSACWSVFLSICLPVLLFACMLVCLSFCLSVCGSLTKPCGSLRGTQVELGLQELGPEGGHASDKGGLCGASQAQEQEGRVLQEDQDRSVYSRWSEGEKQRESESIPNYISFLYYKEITQFI